jgi:N-acetylglucosaminyldiphosphoundecaprenol N-acetyl-beta-D-mannosaminyltransferase
MKKQLLGVNITINSKDEILSETENYLQGKSKSSPFVIVTPNPEQLVYAQKDEEFLKLLNRADIALPDGVGIVWAMKLLKTVSLQRISGIDFMSDCVRLANKNNWAIGLVGGQHGVGKKAFAVLQSSYPHLSGWAMEPEEIREEKLAGHIANSNTKIVFVGLSAPKQEQYIDVLKKHSGRVVFMAVGGSFDMIAGGLKRAPLSMQRIGLEWLYRLFQEPWRWKRQTALANFLFLVFRERFFHT